MICLRTNSNLYIQRVFDIDKFIDITNNFSYIDKNLTTDFTEVLTFCLARGFDCAISLGVTTPLITPVMGIS